MNVSDLLAKLAICRSNIMAEICLSHDLPPPIERLVREAIASLDAVLNVSQLYFTTRHGQKVLSQVNDATLQGGGVEGIGLELHAIVEPQKDALR